MSNEETRADELMAEGDKFAKRMSVWGLMSSNSRFEDAKERYVKAANLYKMAKAWNKAGNAFERCAEMNKALDSKHEAMADTVNAAEMYKRINPHKAIAMFRDIAQENVEMGRFGRAAGYLETAADTLEAENELQEAMEVYSKAADFHFSDNANSKGAKCLDKVALISGNLGQYDKSSQIFEQLGNMALESKLLAFGAKKHFLHAGFCLLARGDSVASRLAYDRFCQMDLSFEKSREGQLMFMIIEAFEGMDPDGFSEALAAYDRVCTLDAWETSILLKVKNSIEATSEAAPDLR